MYMLAELTSSGFMRDLALVMIVAGLVTVLFHRIRQPLVLAYIIAGVLIGPHILPFVEHVLEVKPATPPKVVHIGPVEPGGTARQLPSPGQTTQPTQPLESPSPPTTADVTVDATAVHTQEQAGKQPGTQPDTQPIARPVTQSAVPALKQPDTQPDLPLVVRSVEPVTSISPDDLAKPEPRGLIKNPDVIQIMSDMGVVLLMFTMGLQFSLRRLLQVGPSALMAAGLEITLMIWIGYQFGKLMGWGPMDSLFLGAALLSSSTVIIIKTIKDLGIDKEKFVGTIFGILVIDDIVAIAALALLSTIAVTKTLTAGQVTFTVGKLGVFLSMVIVVGLLVVPIITRAVAKYRNKETLLVTALALCFGMSLFALNVGFSLALGAFLIGAVIAETREAGQISTLIEPIRDMFAAIFFVTIGVMFDPMALVENWQVTLLLTFVVVFGKTLSGTLGCLVAGRDLGSSVKVGLGLSQIGEFAFIITSLGLALGVTGPQLFPIAVSVSAITSLLTPFLLKNSDRIVGVVEAKAPHKLIALLEVYTHWVSREQSGENVQAMALRKVVRRAVVQIVINLSIMAGIFIAWSWAHRVVPENLEATLYGRPGVKSLAWLAAMLMSLPLLIATVRKSRAMCMLLADVITMQAPKRPQVKQIRTVISSLLFVVVLIVMTIYLAILTSAIRPPWPALIIMVLGLATLVVAKRHFFIRMYADAQVSLVETLSHPDHVSEEIEGEEAERRVPPTLATCRFHAVEIKPGTRSVGQLIRETQLRSTTGAHIVAIERAGKTLVNPGPDEELHIGDKAMLLGSWEQVKAAEEMLVEPKPLPA